MGTGQTVFASVAGSVDAAASVLLLARSLRRFGGELSTSPMWVLQPRSLTDLAGGEADYPLRAAYDEARLRERRIEVAAGPNDLPFALKVHAAATAEARADGTARVLVFMDPDTLILNEPHDVRLPTGKGFGYRPVHHRLIGSLMGESPDAFWSSMYELCQVPETSVFPMTTCADRQVIRAYFSAGLLVVRPELGLLRHWRDTFVAVGSDPRLIEHYEADGIYRVFIHQAVLAGAILGRIPRSEMVELPELMNYPLHLHSQYSARHRAASLDEVISCRYEGSFEDPDWASVIQVSEGLERWLDGELAQARALADQTR